MPALTVREPSPLLYPLLARTLPAALARLVPLDRQADLLVLVPGCDPSPLIPCRTLLIPGQSDLPALSAAQAVSYGPSPKDTLTFSSLEAGTLVLSLQRKIVTLAGTHLDRQEFPVPDRGGIDLTLAWAGTLLLAGIPPEQLAGMPRTMPAPPAP